MISEQKIVRKIIDKCRTRGLTKLDWLTSYHTFTFNMYSNEARMSFGALRVLNDDTVSPKRGFGKHWHGDMEIASIPLSGELTHGDSEGHSSTIRYGEIQTMTAGTGIAHSEMNNNETEECKFLQIWIEPERRDLEPDYHDFDIKPLLEKNKLNLIVAPNGEVPASLHQNAYFSLGDLDEGTNINYEMHGDQQGVYFFVITGQVDIDGELYGQRDGIGITGLPSISIKAKKLTKLLAIEVPMIE